MRLLEWLRNLARRLRIGWPHHYVATMFPSSYALTGQDATLIYTPASDTTPNAWSFVDQTGAAISTVVTGAAVTVSGLGPGVSITYNASGGTIDKNNNANFLGSQILTNGDTFRPRVTTSASNSTAVNCTVAASPSGVQDTFTVTTAAAVGSGFTFDSGWSLASGTIANGSRAQFTYAPGGLTIPANPAPLRYTKLDGSMARHASSRLSTDLTRPSDTAFDTSVKLSWMTASLRQNFQTIGGTLWFADSDLLDFSATRRFFWSSHVMFSFDIMQVNSKRLRIWPDVGGSLSSSVGNNPDCYFVDKLHRFAIEATGGDLSTDIHAINVNGNANMTPNTGLGLWRSEEHHFQESSLDTYDGIANRRQNGRWDFNPADRWKTRTTANSVMQRNYRAVNTTQISNQGGIPPDITLGSSDHAYCWGLYQNDNWFRCFSSPESSISTTRSNGSNDLGIHPIMQVPAPNSGSASGFGVDFEFMNVGDYLYMVENDATGTIRRIGQKTS